MSDTVNKTRKRTRRTALLCILVLVAALFGGWLYHAKTQRDLNMRLLGAVRKGDVEAARLLLLHGADPNIRDVPEQQLSLWQKIRHALHRDSGSESDQANLHPSTLIELAFLTSLDESNLSREESDVSRENALMIKVLLDSGARPDDCSEGGTTPLMMAVLGDRLETAQTLLDHGANPLARDDTGQLPIHYLAFDEGSQLKVVELLVKRGNNVNAADNEGETVLMKALHKRVDVSILRSLIARGANVNARSKNGNSALLEATGVGDVRTILQLLEYGAEVNVCDQEKFTPLHKAIQEPSRALIKALLVHGAKIDAINKYGDTPLTICVRGGSRPDIVEVLIEYGANVNHRNNAGETALSLAKKQNYTKTIQLLEAAGAKL